jgi:hypothetical protein
MKSLLALLAIGSLSLSGCLSIPTFYTAIEEGDAARVKAELDKGVPVDTLTGIHVGYRTPLNLASINYHAASAEIVRLLLDHGANPNASSDYAWTPLNYAVAYQYRSGKDPAIIRLLLERGADPTIKNDKGVSAYDSAMDRNLDMTPHIAEVRSLLTAAVAKRRQEQTRQEAAINPAAAHVAPVAASAPSPATDNPRLVPSFHAHEAKDDYAVVVGIENYGDLPAATNAERDADTAAAFIRALGVPDRNLILIKGAKATRTGLVKNLETWLPNNVSPKSRVYFYFSGHGSPDPSSGDAYLVPSDGDPQYLPDSGYPLKRLYEKLNALKAREVIVAMDACFTGAGGRSVIAKGTRPLVGKVDTQSGLSSTGKLTVFSASGSDQTSGSDDGTGYGLFTYHWLDGLNGAAKNASGEVTTQSLFDYLKPKVEDAARRANRAQSPQLLSGAAPVVLRGR